MSAFRLIQAYSSWSSARLHPTLSYIRTEHAKMGSCICILATILNRLWYPNANGMKQACLIRGISIIIVSIDRLDFGSALLSCPLVTCGKADVLLCEKAGEVGGGYDTWESLGRTVVRTSVNLTIEGDVDVLDREGGTEGLGQHLIAVTRRYRRLHHPVDAISFVSRGRRDFTISGSPR